MNDVYNLLDIVNFWLISMALPTMILMGAFGLLALSLFLWLKLFRIFSAK